MNKKLNREIKIVEQEYVSVIRKVRESRERAESTRSEGDIHQLGLYLCWRNKLTTELISLYWESLELNKKDHQPNGLMVE